MKEIKEGGFYVGKSEKFDWGIYPNLSRTITTLGDIGVYIGGGMSEIKLKQIDTLSGGAEKIKTQSIVRKLTPRECFRLMCFTDTDFDKVKAVGMSDSQCYKQAGNSIVVTVLEAIFKEMIGD